MPPKAGTATSTTTNLLHLLPNYTASTLPGQIVDLAVSLYSTSKSRAAVLKKDEEIAREYACCVLAVERLKTPLNLPISKLEPRPPVPPRTFDKLLRFLENAIPAGNTTNTPKRRGRPPNSASASKRPRADDDDNIDPELRESAGSASKSRRKQVRKPALADEGDADGVTGGEGRGSPKWLAKFLKRLRPKMQEMLAEHAWNRVLHDDAFLFRVVDSGVRYARQMPAQLTEEGTEQPEAPKDNAPSVVIAVLIVALQWHLGGMALDVPKFAKLCAQELAAGGVVKTTVFGAVVGDAQDLAEDKRDEWMGVGWCAGDFTGEDAAPDMGDNPATAGDGDKAMEADGAEHDDGPIEVPRSRCGPMAQAHPDYQSPEREKEYSQWKGNMMKKIAAVEKEQQEKETEGIAEGVAEDVAEDVAEE